MKSIFLVVTLFGVCFAADTTTTEADPIDEGTTDMPGPQYSAQCSCYGRVGSTDRLSTTQLLGELLNDQPLIEKCDKAGVNDCIKHCVDKVGQVTSDMDLNQPPKTKDGLTSSLGQYICGILGRPLRQKYVYLMAKLQCNKSGNSWSRRWTRYVYTQKKSQQALTCNRDGTASTSV